MGVDMEVIVRICMFDLFCFFTPLPEQYDSIVYGQSKWSS